jgi:hypothetical protein
MKFRVLNNRRSAGVTAREFTRRPARCFKTDDMAFTLLEVMVAIFIFFVAMFAILGVMSQGLNGVRALQKSGPTAGMVASIFCLTNKLEEGSDSDNFEAPYEDYDWARNVEFYASNGLFKVEFVVAHNGNYDSSITFLLYRPDSPNAGNRKVFQK